MNYFITWHKVPGKNKVRLYAYLNEKLDVPSGINSHTFCYLGKEPIAAIERLYREGKLSLEQVLSINDRKYPDLAKLKEEIKKSLMKQETLIKQIDILKAKLEQPASKSVTTRRKNLLNVKLAMLKAIQAGKRPGDWPEYTGGHQEG